MTSGSGSGSTEQPAGTSAKPLPSGCVHPPVRAAQSALRTLSAEEIRAYRAMPYADYLQTPRWRARRNLALRLAKHRCARCGVNRELQVHHTSYARLAEEADEDLQVLCEGCHLGHHVNAIEESVRLYLKIVSDALREGSYTMLADLIEEVKCRCARARIPYADGQVHTAIARLDRDKRLAFQFDPPPQPRVINIGREGEPLTHAEAAGWMAKLGAIAKTIPNVPRFTRRQADGLLVIKTMLAPAVLESIARCEKYERIAAEAEAAEKGAAS